MLRIPRTYVHYVYGAIQSGLTSAVACAIATLPQLAAGTFLRAWATSWLIAWALMLPVVIFAAPFIRLLAIKLTVSDPESTRRF